MRLPTRFLSALVLSTLASLPVFAAPAPAATAEAARILQETGVRGGLVVHLGSGDGKLTAEERPALLGSLEKMLNE